MAVPELSLTEERILLLLVAGWSRREIAIDVGLDERTVDWHVARAAAKLERVSALSQRIQRAANGLGSVAAEGDAGRSGGETG